MIPLVTSHAPMLGRTLLYTAMTRARKLLVMVGQKKALYLAVRDWRRAPRHTTLGGLLDGTLRFGWARSSDDSATEFEAALLEGDGDGTSSEPSLSPDREARQDGSVGPLGAAREP